MYNKSKTGYPTSIKHITENAADTQEARQKFDIPHHLHDTTRHKRRFHQKYFII